jgi:hypothetical protein
MRLMLDFTEGRCALAACQGGGGRESGALLREATRYARAMERHGLAWADGLALLLRAGAAALRGRPANAVAALGRAEARLAEADMAVHAAAARWRRGQLLGGQQGRALVAEAEARIARLGARNPRRIVALNAPGSPD